MKQRPNFRGPCQHSRTGGRPSHPAEYSHGAQATYILAQLSASFDLIGRRAIDINGEEIDINRATLAEQAAGAARCRPMHRSAIFAANMPP